MGRSSSSTYFAYATLLVLVSSLFSAVIPLQTALASHSDIELVEVSDTNPDPGDNITISGFIDGADEDEDVDITISEPGGGSAGNADTQVDADEEFSEEFEIPDPADDGIYEIEVEFGSEDSTFAYFLIDEEDDEAPTESDTDVYEPGDTVEITGEIEDPDPGVDEVTIRVLDPEGDDLGDDIEHDNGDFSLDVELDDSAHAGVYAIMVEYDGDEVGWAIFEVEDGSGGGGGSGEIAATITDATLAPGDEVEITGSIDEDDVEVGEEVFLVVEDPDGDELNISNDSVDPDSNGDFDFTFELDDDAELGTYDVTLSYMDFDDETLTFTVSTSSSGGSGGSGGSAGSSGSDGGLTAKLSKSSYLAGEELVVSGVVPSISSEEDGVSITISTPANFPIATRFPEPESSRSYSASVFLPQSLEEDEDYRVVVNYDDREVELSFDITGKATGGTGGPITVKTDKTSYSVGSTVVISGEVSDALLVDGQQITLQVFNPADAAYRFDPVTPEDDGTFSYSMPVGGPLGVSGEWEVKVTYGGQVAETTFDLTGGVTAPPTYQLKFEDQTFPIEYTSDGTVSSMYLRPAEKKLIISIQDDSEGKLTVTLPRQVIDAVDAGADIKYIVTTIDTQTGEEEQIDITESVTNAEERTIVIDYDAGTDLIEIQGTNVVPEFGVLSAIVLAIAVLSIVVVTARYNKFSAFRQW
jgi:predicted secreted protein with PEFG-CTERM motif